MDSFFRVVFNNKVIRSLIFKAVSNLNKEEGRIVKKYGQCKIKWIVQNKHFQLLLYKLKNENKKRMEFTDELFYSNFLQYNKDLQLLKDILEIFPNFKSKIIIENSCLNPNNETIINYLINEYQIIPTLKSVQNLCYIGELGIVKSFMKIGYFMIEELSDIGLLLCALQSKDLELCKQIIQVDPSLSRLLDNQKSIQLLHDAGNVEFFKILFKKLIKIEENSEISKYPRPYLLDEYSSRYCSFEVFKYLCDNGIPELHYGYSDLYYRDHYKYSFLEKIVSRPISDTKRNDILKYFVEKFDISPEIINNVYTFLAICESNNLGAIIYFDIKFGQEFKITSECVDLAITKNNFEIFDWIYNNRPIDSSQQGFENLTTLMSLPSNSNELQLKLDHQYDTILKFRKNQKQ